MISSSNSMPLRMGIYTDISDQMKVRVGLAQRAAAAGKRWLWCMSVVISVSRVPLFMLFYTDAFACIMLHDSSTLSVL
jgi:hypothetical protein